MDIDPPDVVGVLSGVCAADVMFARKQPPVVQVQIELIEEPSERNMLTDFLDEKTCQLSELKTK